MNLDQYQTMIVIEILLAATVVVAVIVVGVLIYFGNQQQRRALDEIHTNVRQWALGDLEIKRAKAAREVKVKDPLNWLDDKARIATGISPSIRGIAGVLERPDAIVAITENERYLIFSPIKPEQMRKMIHVLDRQRMIRDTSPLTPMRKLGKRRSKVASFELSALNAGTFFDVEADLVWRMVAKRGLSSNQLWVYDMPGPWEKSRS
jgi:hypothetical protein